MNNLQKNKHIPPETLYPIDVWVHVAKCLSCSAIGTRTINGTCPLCGGIFYHLNSRRWTPAVTKLLYRWSWRQFKIVKEIRIVKEGYWDTGEYW